MLNDLGRLWETVLIKSDTKLGIDSEFTRPGVIAFLDKFAKKVKDSRDGDLEFDFRTKREDRKENVSFDDVDKPGGQWYYSSDTE